MVVTNEFLISVPNKWYTCERDGLSLPQGIQAWKVVSTELGTKFYHYYAKDGGLCWRPVTNDGKKLVLTHYRTGGQKSIVRTSQPKEKPTGLFANIFKNPKRKSKPEETDEESNSVSGINWPNTDDIVTSLEYPEKTMEDDELKEIKMTLGRLMPLKQWPGNFATVYQGKLPSHKDPIALKLFTQKKSGLVERYSTMHDYFVSHNIFDSCSYFTEFEFLSNAITIKILINQERVAKKFPIVKMNWMEGKTLETFIDKTNNSKKFRDLSDKFLEMVNKLESLEIAHGDLHPKNIIVDNGQLKLVDYDCIFIKDFKGQQAPEIGDADCQHPNRVNFDYNQKLDRFSALVIYLALVAISEDIQLKEVRGKEFIFKKTDFLKPKESEIFKKLDSMSSKIKLLSSKLQEYCNTNKPNIDSLEKILEG